MPSPVTSTSSRANRGWWDGNADDYQVEHGDFLRDAGFVWCPEGVDEADARLLGEVRGRRVLEIGCWAAQCARWLVAQGAEVAAYDLSHRQLLHALRIDLDARAVMLAKISENIRRIGGKRHNCDPI